MNKPAKRKRPVLVVGATGRIGGELLRLLAAAGKPVRALVRPDSASAKGFPQGVDIVTGDLSEPDSLHAATRGIGAAFIAVRDHPDQVQWESNLIESLEAAGEAQLVKVSAYAASLDPPPGYGRIHAAIEARLRESSLRWTVLQPYMYMQNFLEVADAIRYAGRIPLPLGHCRVAFIDARDVARVAASVLGSAGHDGQTYVLSGGESLRGTDVADAMTTVLERRVTYVPVPQWLAGRLMRLSGVTDWDVEMRAELFQMLRRNGEADTNDTVARLTGAGPTPLEAFLRDHRPVFARFGR
ncbi:MAG: NmrA family NAD(P)-binding protein [Chromatiales bacterium]|nr:MAG: NmrA family NAD(P)-binding protein [Chromatiales bacterium]